MTVGNQHYKARKIEAWDVIECWGLDFNLGNVVKYIARHGTVRSRKRREDLLKAVHYLVRYALSVDPTLSDDIHNYVEDEIKRIK